MPKNNLVKILTVLLILSSLFLILSLFFYSYQTIKSKNSDKGLITRLGKIAEVNNEVNNLTLKIDFGQENDPDIQSLSSNYQTKMILPPNPEQLKIDLTKLTKNLQVMAEFDYASKTLKTLIVLQPQENIFTVKAKITRLENKQLDVMTLEEAPKNLTFTLGDGIKIIDKTSNQERTININGLKKNDNVYLEYDQEKKIYQIILIKSGPK